MSNLSSEPQGKPSPGASGYEKRDANAAWIFGVVAFLFVSGLIMHFCMMGVVQRLKKTPVPADAFTGTRRSPHVAAEFANIPHLQLDSTVDLKAFCEREDAELNSYGWIDRTSGVVRIPVDRAMELIAQRGLPARSETNKIQVGPSSFELQQQRPQSQQPEIQGDK